jgi:hypothetical protein
MRHGEHAFTLAGSAGMSFVFRILHVAFEDARIADIARVRLLKWGQVNKVAEVEELGAKAYLCTVIDSYSGNDRGKRHNHEATRYPPRTSMSLKRHTTFAAPMLHWCRTRFLYSYAV